MLQLHVHSDRSHDSSVPIKDYVDYLEKVLSKNELAVLGVTDHNVVPIKVQDALKLSTNKVIVVPGIQWRLYKSFFQAVKRLCTRREILTLGDHDSLSSYIKRGTGYSVSEKDEILGNFREREFLDYISKNREIILIVPHPKHLVVDYYGAKEIRKLQRKINNKKIKIPFFVESKTGYDPFSRIFFKYRGKYLTIGGSDAHEIYSCLGTNSLFSVETSLDCDAELVKLWSRVVRGRDVRLYKRVVKDVFALLQDENKKIVIKKHFLASELHFLHCVPNFFKRRFNDFPRNLFK